METMKDVLCFLNEFDFADKLKNGDLEKVAEFEKVVVRKIKDYHLSIIYRK